MCNDNTARIIHDAIKLIEKLLNKTEIAIEKKDQIRKNLYSISLNKKDKDKWYLRPSYNYAEMILSCLPIDEATKSILQQEWEKSKESKRKWEIAVWNIVLSIIVLVIKGLFCKYPQPWSMQALDFPAIASSLGISFLIGYSLHVFPTNTPTSYFERAKKHKAIQILFLFRPTLSVVPLIPPISNYIVAALFFTYANITFRVTDCKSYEEITWPVCIKFKNAVNDSLGNACKGTTLSIHETETTEIICRRFSLSNPEISIQEILDKDDKPLEFSQFKKRPTPENNVWKYEVCLK